MNLTIFIKKDPIQKKAEFAKKLKSGKLLRFPGAYNPLVAKLIEKIGYDGVYVSGGVMANDLGFPDIGLTTLQDVSTRSYLISRITNLPTIVDIDTGFKSCRETIETFEEFGITAVNLEDQIERKRCGHLDNKELISTDAMVKKIKECVSAKKDKNLFLKPALFLKVKVAFIRVIDQGVRVSYGGKFVSTRKTKLAVLSIGYADGVPRNLSGKIKGIFKNKLYPQVGSITMDQMMVDITGSDEIKVGSTMVLLGSEGDQTISPIDWARESNTIPWEILCSFKNRLPRVQVD